MRRFRVEVSKRIEYSAVVQVRVDDDSLTFSDALGRARDLAIAMARGEADVEWSETTKPIVTWQRVDQVE